MAAASAGAAEGERLAPPSCKLQLAAGGSTSPSLAGGAA
eukprot:COSAG01_NODE_249_length_20357_cov_3.458171_28_plen_39_part_00